MLADPKVGDKAVGRPLAREAMLERCTALWATVGIAGLCNPPEGLEVLDIGEWP